MCVCVPEFDLCSVWLRGVIYNWILDRPALPGAHFALVSVSEKYHLSELDSDLSRGVDRHNRACIVVANVSIPFELFSKFFHVC